MTFRSFFESVLDFLYPPMCVSCAAEGEWWCGACRRSVEPSHDDPSPPDGVDALVVTGYYHDPKLRAAIHALKYSGVTRIQTEMGEYMGDFAARRGGPMRPPLVDMPPPADVHSPGTGADASVCPYRFPWPEGVAIQAIPTSIRRSRSRGFDQATILADLLKENAFRSSERLDLLERNGGNIAQATLESPELRAKNAKGTFKIKPNVVVPKIILLVDDVVTSGSTMGEAARVLRTNGAEHVFGFAIALGK